MPDRFWVWVMKDPARTALVLATLIFVTAGALVLADRARAAVTTATTLTVLGGRAVKRSYDMKVATERQRRAARKTQAESDELNRPPEPRDADDFNARWGDL